MQMVTGLDPLTGLVAPPIPFEETINPASPNFMKWNFTQPDPMRYMPCVEPVVAMGTRAVERVFGAIFGSRDACQGAPDAPSQFTDADWNTWKMVEIRLPAPARNGRCSGTCPACVTRTPRTWCWPRRAWAS